MAIDKLAQTFNKGNAYAAIKEVIAGNATIEEFAEAIKPRVGGAVAVPSIEEDGVTKYWCRLSESYLPEEEMTFTNGKSKHIGLLQAKIEYRIKKKAKELKDQALACFLKEDMAAGIKLNQEAKEYEQLAEDPAAYTKEAMTTGVTAEFNPELKKAEELV